MIKRSDLVQKMALWTGADQGDVQEIARRLAEAGHMSLGRPGRYGGAEQTARDAGNLLLAVASGENGIRAARKFEQLQLMKSSHAYSGSDDENWNIGEFRDYFRIEQSDSLSECFTKIIYAHSRGFSAQQKQAESEVILTFPELSAEICFSWPEDAIDAKAYYSHDDFKYPINESGGPAVDLDKWFLEKHGFIFTCKIETDRTIYTDIFLFLGRFLASSPEPWPWDIHPWLDRRDYLENPKKPWVSAMPVLDA
jgi:hypothetical protein